MEGIALAQTSWSSSLLGIFCMIVGVFAFIILALTCYIVRFKRKTHKKTPTLGRNRNRVHSQAHSTVSSANLVTHEKMPGHNGINGNGVAVTTGGGGVSVLHMKHGTNVTMSNPISNGIHHHSSSNSLANIGAPSTILERARERESYAATVRSIVSRASANGQLYEEDEIEQDSLSNQDTVATDNNNKKAAWEPNTNVATINCSNGSANGNGSNLLAATDAMGSSENNLTVYF